MAGLTGYQKICDSGQVTDGGQGIRFRVYREDEYAPAFIVRYNETVYGYLNRCAHQAVELDWNEGEFFDVERRFLVCATHGALYDPVEGTCVSGRCRGIGLTRLSIKETDNEVYVASDYPVKLK